MPFYTLIPLDFELWTGSQQPVFRKTRKVFAVDEIRQNKLADRSARQLFFEEQLTRVSRCMPDSGIPIFGRWNDGQARRLDLGCIGHSLRRRFIEQPLNDPLLGYVTQLQLRVGR